MARKFLSSVVFVLITALLLPHFVFGEISQGTSLSSDSFRILDAQHSLFGGISSSSSSTFLLTATIGDLAIGSSSFTSFGLRSGFLYFPKVIAAVLNTATAGDAQVSLSWTAATAYQGWTIGGYNVCHKSTGSYTCVDVGNVTSFTKTGLTNGTTYTFKIQAYDGLAAKNIIAESNEKTAAPQASATPTPTPPPGGGGGGGGGGGYVAADTGVIIMRGVAYPNSTVTILLDGNIISSIRADGNSRFDVQLNVPVGSRNISVYSEDVNGRKSTTMVFSVLVVKGVSVTLNVFLPPTIDLNTFLVERGGTLRIFGYTAPSAEVDIHVLSKETIVPTSANSLGAYAVRFNTQPLREDEHTTKSRAIFESELSSFSSVLKFRVGKEARKLKTADLNKDGRVNIIDFSILLYWWETKTLRGLDIADINDDGKINIVDFSIMLFQWTG